MDYGTKYMTLSNNKEIGENLVEDLKTYFILLFKNKYKYNYRIWNKIEDKDTISNKIYQNTADAHHADTSNIYMYYDLDGEKDNNPEIKEIEKYIKNNMKEEDDEKKKGEELSNKSSIEIPEKIYNQDISLKKNYRDKSIELGYIPIISVVEVDKTTSNYYSPLLEYNYTNYDFQEKAQIYDDLNKLNIIFKNANYKNIDDMVLLDFYKEFTSKIKKLKDDIISTDTDLKDEIINNIYDKLLIIYDVKTNGIKKFNKTTTKLDTINCKDSHLHGKKEPFDIIKCEIFKRAEILKKLGKEQKGGDPSDEDKEKLNTALTTIFTTAEEKTKEDMYKNYLEIDKNILSAIINSDELKKKIIDKKVTKNIASFKKFTKDVFKITAKTPKKNNIAESITFKNFTDFIQKIKDKLTEDSIRYLTIIKYLNIIKNTNPKGGMSSGGAPPQNQDKQKQINQNQEINSQEQNPGKKYLKNFTDIYITLVKEYYKFIKEPELAKQFIKDITADTETAATAEEEAKKTTEEAERKEKEEAARKEKEEKEEAARKEKEREDEVNKRLDEWNKMRKINMELSTTSISGSPGKQDKDAIAAKLKAKNIQENKEFENEISRNNVQKKNLETRRKELEESLKTIKVVLRKLYNECINIQAPYATEYSEYTKSIIKIGKLKLLIDDNVEINNNNDIVSAYNDQIALITKEIGAKEQQNESLKEKQKINNQQRGGYQNGGTLKDDDAAKREVQPAKPAEVQPAKPAEVQPAKPAEVQPAKPAEVQPAKPAEVQPAETAETAEKAEVNAQKKKFEDEIIKRKDDESKEKQELKKILDDNLDKLIKKSIDGKESDLNNLYDFIVYLKESFGGDDDDNNNMDTVSSKKYNDKDTLFEKIWNEYNDGIKAYNINSKNKEYLTYINEGEKLKNKIILNDLDPEIVLKVNFQDKVVFVALMFAIRTIVMVIFEFLIEYNIIKSLRYAILIYAGLYVLLLLLFTAFVNLDSYKLRIVFNYLNMHINTSNIILHIMLFTIFSFLVIVIIQTDNFINNVGDILDFTYIYNYIYTFNIDNLLSGEFENNLSKDEKIKLQYRLDIISMLIFIFTATLILLI